MEVAILLATYNSGRYLEELLESLLNQTYKDFICYVHDDGSCDSTCEIVRRYSDTTELSIELLDYPPTGSAKANFISMLKFVEEPYVMFCDHDDVWCKDKIERSLKAIKSIEMNGKPALVFSDLTVVDQNLNVISDSFMTYTGINPERIELRSLLLENVAAGCTMMVNKPLYLLARKLSNINNIPMHDHWFILVAAALGDIKYVKSSTILYRQHAINELGAVKELSFFARLRIVSKRILSKDYDFAEWLAIRQRQAGELSLLPGLSKEDQHFLVRFSELKEENKIKRIFFYMKNGVARRKYNFLFLLRC